MIPAHDLCVIIISNPRTTSRIINSRLKSIATTVMVAVCVCVCFFVVLVAVAIRQFHI